MGFVPAVDKKTLKTPVIVSVAVSLVLGLSACTGIDIPAYKGHNERSSVSYRGTPVSQLSFFSSMDTGNLAVRFDLNLDEEVYYRNGEKDYANVIREFRLIRKTSESMLGYDFKAADPVYPSYVADYQYDITKPLLIGRWEYDASRCQVLLRDKAGKLLMRLQGRKGQQTLNYKQGGLHTSPVMIFEIAERSDSPLLSKPELAELWQRGHLYDDGKQARCDGKW